MYVTIIYCNSSATGRQAHITVDGGTPQLLSFTPHGQLRHGRRDDRGRRADRWEQHHRAIESDGVRARHERDHRGQLAALTPS
jgi:hypothetical protein